MHKIHANMTYAHITCQHAYTIYQHAICTCNMPLLQLRHMQYACRSACARQPPGTAQRSKFTDITTRGFPFITLRKKTLKLWRSQARLETNVRNRWENHALPTCQGPWGTLHQVSRLYTQVPNNRLGKVMPVLISCFLLNFSRSHCISIAAWLAQPGATVPVVGLAYPDGQCLRKTYEGAG